MKLLAIIPARGGSKGVPRKNLRMLAGKPLIVHTIEAARAAAALDRVILSTDDAEIAATGRAHGIEVLPRPAELAGDDATTLSVLRHVVATLAERDGYRPDAVMTLQPTSPLRRAAHIDAAAAAFAADPRADSLVSCVDVPHIFHPRSVMRLDAEGYLVPYLEQAGPAPTRRQDKEPVFARNGAAIYITRTERLDQYVFGGRLIPFAMAPEDSVDIDTLDDLAEAEAVLARRAAP